MPVKQSTPGEGGQRKGLHFTYTPTDPAKPWHAYIAGPCVWLDCHCKGKTKPCLDRITSSCLACPLCDPLNPWEPTGFQPLWREIDWKPVFVIVHESTREKVDSFKHRMRVLIGREGGATDGVWITPPLKAGGWLTSTDKQKMAEQDIIPTLIRIWKNEPLSQWYQRETGVAAWGCNTPTEKPASIPLPPRFTVRGGDGADTAGINDAFVRLAREGKLTNGKNGTHPPDEPTGEGV